MKAIRIIAPEVHDGLGGIHRQGDVVSLPDDVTKVFLERGVAVVASEVDFKQAKELARQHEDDRRAAELHGQARARMGQFDNLPPEVRDALRETDGSVHEAAVKHLAAPEIITDEWDDPDFAEPEPEPEDDPRPSKKRGKRRRSDET